MNKGHHDYKNVSRLGSYHYHNGLPAHSYEDNVKNTMFSGLDDLVNKILAEFEYYVSQVTDLERRESLIIGIIAGIIQNILKSGLDTTEILLIIADIAANCL